MSEEELRNLLPEHDVDYLLSKELRETVSVRRVGTEIHVEFREYPFSPKHYTPEKATLLVRLIPPYPNGNPDMFWTLPDIKLLSGQMPLNSAHTEIPAPTGFEDAYNRMQWQRWSRHFAKESWRPNVDGL